VEGIGLGAAVMEPAITRQ